MRKIKFQLVKVLVSQAGEQVRIQAETDKLYDRVTGIYVFTPFYRYHTGSTIELKIAEEEIFPEGFDTKIIASNMSVSPSQRFYTFESDEEIIAKGNLVSGKYSDGGNESGIIYPYTMTLVLKLKKDS